MPAFQQIDRGWNGVNYAKMLLPVPSAKSGYYACAWYPDNQPAEECPERRAMWELHDKVGGTLKEFHGKEIAEVVKTDERFKNLMPVGAQFVKKLSVLVFDL
ncbi:hypothetical protein AYJ57_21300 (plasmid) [Salipiger sp. CCB-MM3]|uniref:hypothetical protein n=1 Tax=Salipiger sp. CCB-MM3 TaxID=1792508 RepID=UPI00080AC189|nr:hypothetical protein [Salipiger sp. CCB-MM3]ANT63014.1 hypothetical protein AYJ57_21300 [Salipiger sp. CCB-MM3]